MNVLPRRGAGRCKMSWFCLLFRDEGGMLSLAINQPPDLPKGGHLAPVTLAMLRAACPEHPRVLPFQAALPAAELHGNRWVLKQAGTPFPSPKFFCLQQGKAPQTPLCSWLRLGCNPWKSLEKGKEGGRSPRCWCPPRHGDRLPTSDVALPWDAAGVRGSTEGRRLGRGNLSARHPCHGHLHQYQQYPSIPPLLTNPCLLPVPSCLIDTFQGMFDDQSSSVLSTGAGPIYQVLSCCQGRGRKQKIYRFN